LGDWSWEPTVLLGLAALSIAYALAIRRGVISERDNTEPWLRSPKLRPVFFASGVVVGLVALQSPIDVGGDNYLFSMHMLQHLLLMMVAPPLVLLGICGVRARPRGSATLRRIWWLITRPWPAVIIFNAVMLVWHLPALYNTTLTVEPVHVLEHVSFLAAGIVFWWPVVDPVRGPATKTVSPLTKIAMLAISGIPPTVLGLIFAISPVAFYDFYVRAPRLWGISPVADQQIGGVAMLGLGNIVYALAIIIIFVRLLSDPAGDEGEAARRLGEAVPR
jgi:putative membrane protein